jgi:hypothetical protein
MFALTPRDPGGRILDCAAGPASLNAEATAAGRRVVSCDPLYRLSAEDTRNRVVETSGTLIAHARAARDRFVWRDIRSPEHLGEVRLAVMDRFLANFPSGLAGDRYRTDELPHLAFGDDEFDLALCSHFLFLYSDQLSADFHVAAIQEMCRVAGEARVFPLLGAYGAPSPHVEPVIRVLRERGYGAEVRRVAYEFLRGGDEMLSVSGP